MGNNRNSDRKRPIEASASSRPRRSGESGFAACPPLRARLGRRGPSRTNHRQLRPGRRGSGRETFSPLTFVWPASTQAGQTNVISPMRRRFRKEKHKQEKIQANKNQTNNEMKNKQKYRKTKKKGPELGKGKIKTASGRSSKQKREKQDLNYLSKKPANAIEKSNRPNETAAHRPSSPGRGRRAKRASRAPFFLARRTIPNRSRGKRRAWEEKEGPSPKP